MAEQELAPLARAVEAARALGAGVRLGTERVAVVDAVGRTLAVAAVAEHALPGFASSAMDGFAVRSADLATAADDAPVSLVIVDESRAGGPAEMSAGAGEAVRIATGAVVPEGTDAVVPYEDADEADGRVTIAGAVSAGRFVRRAGTDVQAGAVVAGAGLRLRPQHLAPIAGSGFATVAVCRRPRVSVLLTGDEVVRAGQADGPLPPGAVHDVNGVVVPALLASWGADVAEVVYLPDDREATRAALAAATGDLVVVCGGLSMGPHDHVRPALGELGARQDLFRIALQPGKPTWLGALPGAAGDGDRPVFGLPGNPASVFVTATLLVRVAIDEALGCAPTTTLRGRLTAATAGLPGRTAVRRACVSVYPEGTLAVELLAGQASHLLGSLGAANALAIVPPGVDLPAGAVVDVVPLDPADGWAHATGSTDDHLRR